MCREGSPSYVQLLWETCRTECLREASGIALPVKVSGISEAEVSSSREAPAQVKHPASTENSGKLKKEVPRADLGDLSVQALTVLTPKFPPHCLAVHKGSANSLR